jgi:sulfhydrogenase subunit beta (sulfur reductase)
LAFLFRSRIEEEKPHEGFAMSDAFVIDCGHFEELFGVLQRQGYQPVGPTVLDGAIAYDALGSTSDLPIGVSDEQAAGSYRTQKRADRALFGYTCGAHSWKKFLYPADLRLYEVMKSDGGLRAMPEKDVAPRLAFIGVRPCELRAIAIHDRILLQAEHPETFYSARREPALLVAVNCTKAGGTCFCTSMGGGPKAVSGFDLALTEVFNDDRHFFLVMIGSSRGAEILRGISYRPASEDEVAFGEKLIAQAAERMGRALDTTNIQQLLYENTEHPHWEQVAQRCLTCGNCTMVCPTCFCTTVEDTTNLAGDLAERRRKWDSCFSLDFSYIHGGPVRSSAKARYRHWITHKFAAWIEQFGTSGCVGCGRCITWCPVGIDVTEEIRLLREGRMVNSDE